VTDEHLDAQRLRRLLEVGRSLVSELDLEIVLDRVLEVARELTGARYAALGILDDRRQELERFLTRGIDAETHRAIGDLPRGHGILGVLISDPRPLRLPDVGDHPRSYGFPLGHPPMHTFLGVPILIRGQAYGNLYLTEKAEGEFDEADEEALVVLADWAAIAIENARLYRGVAARRDELERAVSALETTSSIARAVGGETDLERILELLVKRGRALVDARAMLVALREDDELVVEAAAGEVPADVVGRRIAVEGSVAGDVLRTQQPERLADAPSRLRFALAEHVGAATGLIVPLVFRGEAVGVLAAFDRTVAGPEFSAEDQRLVQAFAASAATAVMTARSVAAHGLKRSVEASERERVRWARELHDETLQELAALRIALSSARSSGDATALEQAAEEAIERATAAIAGLRSLITDMRPASLDELGAGPALEALIDRTRRLSGLTVRADIDLAYEAGREADRHDPEIEVAIYRFVQEGLTNAVKHAGDARVVVTVAEGADEIVVGVRDDGPGFATDAHHEGFGLIGLRERVELVGGTVTVQSGPGAGTTLEASLPVRRRTGARATRLDVAS
jgi:two-component system, NarL family, sensor histidine kinase DevS